MLELAERLGAQTLATGHYARVEGGARCCAWPPTSPRTRATCSRRSRPPRCSACASRSARCARPQVRELAARGRAARSRASATRRTSASSPARATRDFLERHGGLGDAPGPIVDAGRRACSASTRGAHLYTVGQRHGLGIGAAAAAVRARHRHERQHRHRRARAASCWRRAARARADAAPPAARASTACACASHGRRFACRLARELRAPGATRARASSCAEPAERTAPGPARVPVRRRAGRRLRHDRRLAAAAVRPKHLRCLAR